MMLRRESVAALLALLAIAPVASAQVEGLLPPGQVSCSAGNGDNGGGFTCAIKTDATLWCWGNNPFGQLGIGTLDNVTTPTEVAGGGAWATVAVGGSQTCAIKATDASMWCWGRANLGQIGANSTTGSLSPREVTGGGAWAAVAAGDAHVCALKSDGSAWCWGWNEYGQVGDGSAATALAPVPVSGGGTWTAITCGGYHSCALAAGSSELWCWGWNDDGQVGDGTQVDRKVPVQVAGGGAWSYVDGGLAHTCGIRAGSAAAECWGWNSELGELGIGSLEDRTTPTPVAGNGTWAQLASGQGHTCALTQGAQQWWCWGTTIAEVLANGTAVDGLTLGPEAVPYTTESWAELAAANDRSVTCGIKSADSTLWCTGSNGFGQLGDGTKVPKAGLVQVAGGGTWGNTADQLPPLAATAAAPPGADGGGGDSLSTGAIVGIVIAAVAAAALAAAALFVVRKKKRGASTASATSKDDAAAMESASLPPLTPPTDLLASPFMMSIAANEALRSDPVLSSIASSLRGGQITPASRGSSGGSSADLQVIDVSELQVRRIIGGGGFGCVYEANWRHTPCAVKMLVDARGADAARAPEGSAAKMARLVAQLEKEAALMAALRHPSVLQVLGVVTRPPALVTEFMPRGSVTDVYRAAAADPSGAGAKLTWKRRLGMLLDAANGLLYLHQRSPPMLHRDLKSPNLLVAADWHVKVADFGLSKLVAERSVASATSAGGATNPRWVSPEIFEGADFSPAADVYAFGVVMYELLAWALPWAGANEWTIYPAVHRGERPALPATLPGPPPPSAAALEAYKALMVRCWAQDAAARPTAADIAAELATLAAAA